LRNFLSRLFRRNQTIVTNVSVNHQVNVIRDDADYIDALENRIADLLVANTDYVMRLQARGIRVKELETENAELRAQIPVAA
jgi:hypothetical protein